MSRGVLYIVWGKSVEPLLQRSIASAKKFYPDMPVEIVRAPEEARKGLMQKTKMGSLTPFETTLFLDADTVVLGKLDEAFARAEEFGLACCINECPWMRRYGNQEEDAIEYNTGVIFFTKKAKPVMDAWESTAPAAESSSRWITPRGELRGLEYDDQAGFGRAMRQCRFNPYVLPLNYNYRWGFHLNFFAPLKVWHGPPDPPAAIVQTSAACENGTSPVAFMEAGFVNRPREFEL